jgi:hypothetical protein
MLESLLVRVRNGLLHPLHVPPLGLQQAPQVLPRGGGRGPSPGHEEPIETTREGAKPTTYRS